MSNQQTIDIPSEAAPSQAVAVRPAMAVGQAMGVNEILAQVKLIQDVMRSVMTEGEHYGTIPGCGDKKTLLQPGAQKLTMTFRLAPEYQIQEVNLDRGHKEFRIICTLKSIQTGNFVGQGVGCCSSMESKYRFRGGARKCPKCGKETIIKGKAQYGGGWLCWGKRGGCDAKWPDGAKEIEDQSIEKVENENPADSFNTVLKMAKKRAFVDATITATAASDIFTQDIGDEENPEQGESPQPPPGRAGGVSTPNQAPRTAATRQSATNPPLKAQPVAAEAHKTATTRYPTEKTRLWMVEELKNCADLALEYFQKVGPPSQLLPNEGLADLPLRFVPVNRGQMAALKDAISAFGNGEDACAAFPPNAEAPGEAPAKSAGDVAGAVTASPAAAQAAAKAPTDDEWWREIIVPVPHKGEPRAEYMKHPDTIGSLFDARHGTDDLAAEARQRLFGFVNHYEPKGWEKRDGTKMPPSAADLKFREALDAFADWFEKHHEGEKL